MEFFSQEGAKAVRHTDADERCWHRRVSLLEAKQVRENFPLFLEKSFATLNVGAEFLPNWHLEVLANYLTAVENGWIKRLIINMPPRYLKSLTVSAAWPAWLLAMQPSQRIITSCYGEKLSLKHSLDSRAIVQSPWYKRIFPHTRILLGQNEKHKFVTTEHGFRLAASIGGALTGEGGDVLIIDDPINPQNAESRTSRDLANRWFENTLSSRLNNKKTGAIVIVMQRLHEDDLTGFLLKKTGWHLLNLPAIAPLTVSYNRHIRFEGEVLHCAREDENQLKRVKAEMGSHAFSAQYQQRPQPKEGAMIRRHWLQYQPSDPNREGMIIQSWDTAIKTGAANDPSVCITAKVSEHDCEILEVLREKLPYHTLRATLLAQTERWNPHSILIEDKASGQSLLQDLRRETALPLIAIMPIKDKITRFAAITPLIEAGKVILPKQASWLAEFEHELLGFPAVSHDDQVDALSQLLNWWQKRQSMVGMRRV